MATIAGPEVDLDTHDYSRPEYWDKRYARDRESFDWYQTYDGSKEFLNKYIPKDSAILIVGCGNSKLSEDMVLDGYNAEKVISIDISSVVIQLMKEQAPYMRWEVVDVTALPYPDRSFQAIIDKGTMDALLCGDGSYGKVDKMLSGISRLLTPGGVFILVTYGNPDTRLRYIQRPRYHWKVDHFQIKKAYEDTGDESEEEKEEEEGDEDDFGLSEEEDEEEEENGKSEAKMTQQVSSKTTSLATTNSDSSSSPTKRTGTSVQSVEKKTVKKSKKIGDHFNHVYVMTKEGPTAS